MENGFKKQNKMHIYTNRNLSFQLITYKQIHTHTHTPKTEKTYNKNKKSFINKMLS